MSSFFAGGGRHPAGGLLSLSPAYPAFRLISFPHPPDPLPLRGRGRLKVILCKGLRPLHPRGLNPGGTGYPCRCGRLNGGQFPPAALVRPAPGERTISNAAVALATDSSISPGPPLSLAAGFAHREPSPFVFAENRRFSPPAWYLLGRFCKCRLRFSRGDARGEAPCIENKKSPPSPPGKGAGGIGGRKES